MQVRTGELLLAGALGYIAWRIGLVRLDWSALDHPEDEATLNEVEEATHSVCALCGVEYPEVREEQVPWLLLAFHEDSPRDPILACSTEHLEVLLTEYE